MTLFPRGGVLWLLAHELRLAFRSNMRVNVIWRVLGVIILLAVAGFGGAGIGLGLKALQGFAGPPAFAALSAAGVFAFVLALLSGLIIGVEALYKRQDLDLLFSSPLDPRTVLTVRALGVAASASAMLLALSFSATLWLLAWGEWRAAAILPYALGVAALAAAAALSLSLALFRTIGPRATRTAVQIVAALFGATAFLVTQLPNFLPYQERAAWFASLPQRVIALAPPAESPLWLPAKAAMGDPLAILGWLLVTIGPFVLVVRGFGRRYAADAAAIVSLAGPVRQGASLERLDRPFQSSFAAGVFAKEWRLLRRDPALVAQLLLQLVYLAPILFVGFARLGTGGRDEVFFAGTLAGVITLFSGVIAGLLTWLMISAEDAPDLIASAPVKKARVERLKAAAAVAPTLAVAMLPTIGLATFSLAAAFWAALWASIAACVNAAIYTRHQRPMPRSALSTKSKASFVVTVLSGVVNTTWSSAAGFCAAGYWPAALIPAFIGIGLTIAVLDMKVEEPPPPKPARRGWFGLMRPKAP